MEIVSVDHTPFWTFLLGAFLLLAFVAILFELAVRRVRRR